MPRNPGQSARSVTIRYNPLQSVTTSQIFFACGGPLGRPDTAGAPAGAYSSRAPQWSVRGVVSGPLGARWLGSCRAASSVEVQVARQLPSCLVADVGHSGARWLGSCRAASWRTWAIQDFPNDTQMAQDSVRDTRRDGGERRPSCHVCRVHARVTVCAEAGATGPRPGRKSGTPYTLDSEAEGSRWVLC